MFNRKKQNKTIERNPGLVVANRPKSIVAEQFRTVRTNIQFSMIDKQLQSLVVTSAGPNSGKSLIAANLATTFASADFRVLLVDADLRLPSVHQTFKLRNNDGLTTLLLDPSLSVSDMVYKTHTEGLYLITSGPVPPNPSEMLASKRMAAIKNEMKGLFDLIIFDTSPLLPVTDAQVMASQADGTIVVIPKGKATKEEVFKAKELLDIVEANVIGAILNRTERGNGSYYYYNSEV